METIKAIVLKYNKSINELLVPKSICTGQLDISLVNGIKSKGYGNIERECDFEWDDDTVSIYAWTNGSESKINQHDLPPPIDSVLYYGDVLVIRHENGKLKDFSKINYNKFYEDAFGGFDDIISEEESSDEEPTQSDIDFIASESEISEESMSSEEEALSSSECESEEDSEELNLNDTNSTSIDSGDKDSVDKSNDDSDDKDTADDSVDKSNDDSKK
tara:strand:- start:8448 stop:9098 length:651 start_codon:yes stop_codon:yes gene_type:complete